MKFFLTISSEIELQEEELPIKGTTMTDYLLEPAMNEDDDKGMVVFCIDVSGSMCVSTEVPALQSEWKKLRSQGFYLFILLFIIFISILIFPSGKGGNSKKPKDNFGAEGDQYLPGQRRDASYISRLECMKMAASTHLQRLKVHQTSYVRVALHLTYFIIFHLSDQISRKTCCHHYFQ